MEHRDRSLLLGQVMANLQGAADVGTGRQLGAGAGQVGRLELAELGGLPRLHQVVDAGAAAAHARLRGLPQQQVGDPAQQGPGLGADALAVQHVTGIVIGHRQRPLGGGGAAVSVGKGGQAGPEGLAQAQTVQEFMYVPHLGCKGPAALAAQDRAVGLEGVAAAGGRHQHRIEGFGPRRSARAQHGSEAVDHGGGELFGVRQLALVVGNGAAAALIRRDHHLDAVGAQHLHHGPVHRWIKQALDAAQQQPHPGPPLAAGRHHRREAGLEGLGGQGGQQPLHRLELGAEQAGEAAAAGQGLQRRAGIGPQGSQHRPQPRRVGEQGK